MGQYADLLDAAVQSTLDDEARGESYADLLDSAVQSTLDAEAWERGRTALIVGMSKPTNPDQHAADAALGARFGMPASIVSRNREEFQRRAAASDARRVFDGSPRLRSWIAADRERANLAHDDLPELAGIEAALRTLKNMPRAIAGSLPRAGANLWGAAAAPFEVAGQGFRAAEDAIAGAMGAPRGMGRNVGEAVGGFLLNEQRAGQAVAADVFTVPADAGVIERGIYSGLQSATQALLTLPVALRQGGQNVALGIMGAVAGGPSFTCARSPRA